MAAYASLVSLTHVLNNILSPPPTYHIIINTEQIESLQEKVSFLIEFLEKYYSIRAHNKEIDDLETRIADAAYEAEDIIESNVIEQIREGNSINRENISITNLCEGVQTIIEKFHSIEKELVKIEDEKGGVEDQRPKIYTMDTSPSRPLPSGKNINTMVGFEKHLIEIMSALTTDESNLRIVPIVGMGGIGKTTLATNVYNNPFIVEHFHIRAWITISQEYSMRDLLLGLLYQVHKDIPNEKERSEDLAAFADEMSKKDDDQLGELLHKELFERKYLIVMDDMWNIEAWDGVKRFLPDNFNGSRVLVTTRLLKLVVDLGSCSHYKMDFLDEEKSWDLLREKVFNAQERCPVELEKIGKRIAKRCGGLPLALAVVGGLLAKSQKTKEDWEYVEGDVASAVNNGNEELFMKILSLSYTNLPIYLKPCFLYFAVFPEDFEIRVSRLIRLWVAEGLIKQTRNKILEEVAEEYFEDLIDRNLILVRKRGSSGNVKTCSIHDLLRDLCKREAHRDKFMRIAKLDNHNISPYIESERRLSIDNSGKEKKVRKVLKSARFNRSLLCYSKWDSKSIARSFSLLRVLDVVDKYSGDEILQLMNSRYVACSMNKDLHALSYMPLHWNLQTLIVDGCCTLPPEIWQMSRLRHIKIKKVVIPDSSLADAHSIVVLENLQTLTTIRNFRWCSEEAFKRILNLKKLGINYTVKGLNNLVHLHKLESLAIASDGLRDIVFPSSLKKLTLKGCRVPWEHMSIVGSLPNLEVLKLLRRAVHGLEWNPIEGEFCRLKFLMIHDCELEIWRADNTHFPSLERLFLENLRLKKIPLGFAEIPTLQVISVQRSGALTSYKLRKSIKKISDERESLGYEVLQFQAMQSLL